MIDQQEYQQRRDAVFAKMHNNSIAILTAAEEKQRTGDAFYLYRQNSDFYYLTGFNEPNAVLVLIKQAQQNRYILFVQPHDPLQEQWTGKRLGVDAAVKTLHANESYNISEFELKIIELMQNKESIYYALGRNTNLDLKINQTINTLKQNPRAGITAPTKILDIETIVHSLRQIKSPVEITMLTKAIEITAAGVKKAMQTCKPDMFEYEIHAELLHTYHKNGAQAESFPAIVASGDNACILHYEANDKQLKSGDLLLIDTGAEYKNYAGDITRTFPINGKFSVEQKAIYEVVLDANLQAINAAKPGNTWDMTQNAAALSIAKGLLALGILQGSLAELIDSEAYKKFYLHHIGHWLGIDCHDVGPYKTDTGFMVLKPGMLLTIEPGIYIKPGTEGVDEKWWGIGIRIEDDILITSDGNKNLSKSVPKSIHDIEAFMAATFS
jgi:Xaa-Pro aminopeptidase